MRCAADFWRGLTPTVCANRYTATDFCPASSSRLQRRQYKLSKRSVPDYRQGLFTLLSPTSRRRHKYAEGFPPARSVLSPSSIGPLSVSPSSGPNQACSSQRQSASRNLSAMGVGLTGLSAESLQSSRLSKTRQQVAAVCYRIRKRGIEFLLVQTRGGRWIFPKGGAEPGFTHAQSAALEAFEEAGVHGRIEEIPFARYSRRKTDAAVTAYLCAVSRLERPQESNRNPTWFSAEKAKQRLLKNRTPEFGTELARVVDRAEARIRRLHGDSSLPPVLARLEKDALREVRFEAFELGRVHGRAWSASYARYIRREHPDLSAVGAPLGSGRPTLRLGNGTDSSPDTLQKVQFIDGVRSTSRTKTPAKSASNRRK
jgi:8-oxo-dGTP pyrophosphatase MutT (NUDIX family)